MAAATARQSPATGNGERAARHGRPRDYSVWTYEELRALAIQLRIRDAERKTHRDLVELLGG